jgi:hypothetical protein
MQFEKSKNKNKNKTIRIPVIGGKVYVRSPIITKRVLCSKTWDIGQFIKGR